MLYLSDYTADFASRKQRKDKGRKRKITTLGKDKKRTNTGKIISSVNRTSEELRGWTNTAMRLKRMIEGNF